MELDNLEPREKEILVALSKGKSRDQLAREFGHSTFKSLDLYMRRRGYQWDRRKQNYMRPLLKPKFFDSPEVHLAVDRTRAHLVISYLARPHSDITDVAKKLQFSDHMEMARYMQAKGYIWSSQRNNYIRLAEVNETSVVPNKPVVTDSRSDNEIQNTGTSNDEPAMLNCSEEHKEPTAQETSQLMVRITTIPRYVVPGVNIAKCIHVSSALDQLVREFSSEKKIHQREIYEIAVVEFLSKYGYQREVNSLFSQ